MNTHLPFNLAVFRSEYGNYSEALALGAVYQSDRDVFSPEFADIDLSIYLSDIQDSIATVLNCLGSKPGDLQCGAVIHDVFWSIADLSEYFDRYKKWPEFDFKVCLKDIYDEANQGCGLIYEVFTRRFDESVDEFANTFPEGIKAIILKYAADFGYGDSQQDNDDYDPDPEFKTCIHGLDPDCCPAGCGDIEYDTEEDDNNEVPLGYEKATELLALAEQMRLQYIDTGFVSPIKFSLSKLIIQVCPDAMSWYADICGSDFHGIYKKVTKSMVLDDMLEYIRG